MKRHKTQDRTERHLSKAQRIVKNKKDNKFSRAVLTLLVFSQYNVLFFVAFSNEHEGKQKQMNLVMFFIYNFFC